VDIVLDVLGNATFYFLFLEKRIVF